MKELNTIRIGQKVLNLNEMTYNGDYEIGSGYSLDTFVIDQFEFRFECDFEYVGTEYCDFMQYEDPIHDKIYTELVEVINLDTDEIIKLNENQSKLVLKVAQSKI